MSISLDALNHDILIYILASLSIPQILLLRQVSRRLYLASEEHAVWKAACTSEIVRNGIPFPERPLTSFSAKDLERQTLRAYKLSRNWRAPTMTLRRVVSSPVTSGAIEQIRFVSRRGRTWIVTTCIGIWWTLCMRDCDSLEVVADWDPGRALFNGIAVNTDDESDAAIAISVHRHGHSTVEILAICDDESGGITIQPQRTLDTSHKPISLSGDLVALCDHGSETLILNWKTQEQALLKSNPNTWQDKPLHVVFIHGGVVVVRAHSICIFEAPRMVLPGDDLGVLSPRIFRSFGWVDGASLALGPRWSARTSHPPLTLLVRNKGGDPWKPTEQFQLMTLNADFDPNATHATHAMPSDGEGPDSHSSPFNLIATLSSQHRGPFRCSDMVLGSYGTAVWVQPSDWAAGGLITDNSFIEPLLSTTSAGRESLVIALFPGLLKPDSTEAHVKVVVVNDGNGWSCLDYDEAQGLIALGSSSGNVTVYKL